MYNNTFVSISIDSICKNAYYFKSLLQKDTKMMVILKADAYGHGAKEIATAFEKIDFIWGYGVATPKEAIELRDYGIRKPILILGKSDRKYYLLMIENDIRISVDNENEIREISQIAVEINREAKLHVQINTGMNRFGFEIENVHSVIMKTVQLPGIQIEGIYTHAYMVDDSCREYTEEQYHKFISVIENLKSGGVDIPIKHFLNSYGVIRYPKYQMDMVRIGILLYGVFPEKELYDNKINIEPVMSVYSYITSLREVSEGETIGYGATYKVDREMIIATVDIGYADGYPRALSNKGYVLVNGKKAPIVGRICMNQMMVDVTDVYNIKVNDKVTLLGTDGNEEIMVEDIAEICHTISHEILCVFGNSLPRIFESRGE